MIQKKTLIMKKDMIYNPETMTLEKELKYNMFFRNVEEAEVYITNHLNEEYKAVYSLEWNIRGKNIISITLDRDAKEARDFFQDNRIRLSSHMELPQDIYFIYSKIRIGEYYSGNVSDLEKLYVRNTLDRVATGEGIYFSKEEALQYIEENPYMTNESWGVQLGEIEIGREYHKVKAPEPKEWEKARNDIHEMSAWFHGQDIK